MANELITVEDLEAAFDEYHSNQEAKRYGVRFPSGGSNSGTRIWDAIGFTSIPTFGSTIGNSDFVDNADPYKHHRCNIKSGKVVAYENYPSFDEYGSNGDVYEEFPNPYLYISDDETVYGVSMFKWNSDWFRAFVKADGTEPEKIYIPAYKMSKDSDGNGRSIAGVFPYWGSYSNHYSAAQATDSDHCHTGTSMYETWKQVMTTVEYASRDCQNGSGMQGFSGGLYSQTGCKTTSTVSSSNVIPVDNPGSLIVGQTVNICSGWISSDLVTYRLITDIDTTNKTITIDGDPVTLSSSGLTIYNLDWQCGSTLDISGDTGQAVKSSKYSMKWHGIEDIWGGSAEDICDLRLCLDGDSTANPKEVYYCPDPLLAGSSDSPSSDYIDTGVLAVGSNGYIKSFEALDGYPQVRVPVSVGGTSSTYYADYCYFDTSSTTPRAVRSGAFWTGGSGLGVSSRHCGGAASFSSRGFCARLHVTL